MPAAGNCELIRLGQEWIDVVYSADDGGWYAERHSDNATTPVVSSRAGLLAILVDPAEKSTIWELE